MMIRFIRLRNTGMKQLTNIIVCSGRSNAEDASSRYNNAQLIQHDNGSREFKFARPERKELPDKVRFGFVPEEWFQFFYSKTGASGPFVFVTGLAAFLVSKELYVLDHEFYSVIPVTILCYMAVKTTGPHVASMLDRAIDEVEDAWHLAQEGPTRMYRSAIEQEKLEQWRAGGQWLLLEAKKELVAIQLETQYRERLMEAYHEVKRRLDYELERHRVARCVGQRHLVQWVVRGVQAALGPTLEAAALHVCMSQLASLGSHARSLPMPWMPPALSLWVVLLEPRSGEKPALIILL